MKPQNENAPAANRGAKQNNFNSIISPMADFLGLFESVKPSGKGFTACCPVHESKSRSSLSIKEGDDGRVLLFCHAQCAKIDIVHAVGREMADLFVRVIETEKTPRSSWQQRELMKMRRWKAVGPDLLIEVSVLLSAAGQVYQDYPLSEEDRVRMLRAGRLIRSALEYL